jgi:hypothetical protein
MSAGLAESTWLRGHWMQTYLGGRFYPLDPRPEDVHPRDIAHALSLICRYGGHVLRFYSVAEHCLLLSHAVAPEHALWALLHDATEAYVGDMVRPLKVDMPAYCEAEDRVAVAIAARFGLEGTTMPPEVKEADTRILLDERAAVMRPTSDDWQTDGLQPLGVHVCGLPSTVAESLYLQRLAELTGETL